MTAVRYDETGRVRSSSATTGRWSEAVAATARAARIPTAAQAADCQWPW
ncbi:hypothetical protein [Amycolatopsis sp. 3B14]